MLNPLGEDSLRPGLVLALRQNSQTNRQFVEPNPGSTLWETIPLGHLWYSPCDGIVNKSMIICWAKIRPSPLGVDSLWPVSVLLHRLGNCQILHLKLVGPKFGSTNCMVITIKYNLVMAYLVRTVSKYKVPQFSSAPLELLRTG